MGRINITLSDELEKKLRFEISRRLGYKKGNIQIAVEEALRDWIHKPFDYADEEEGTVND